jgi:hypothetical protein
VYVNSGCLGLLTVSSGGFHSLVEPVPCSFLFFKSCRSVFMGYGAFNDDLKNCFFFFADNDGPWPWQFMSAGRGESL